MDFNQIINRNNTGSVKWDFIERHFGDGAGKLLPMWVSDFDFACPPEVQAALHQRIEHGVFGYSERDEAYFNALLHWFSSRHQLTLKQEWVCSVEGVVPGLALLVQMLTHPGDGVVVQGPYYGSFAKIITLNGRKLLENPLSESPDDGYQMDFCQLERLFRHERPPLMILCNPHNPTGRCWSANELEQLLLLCEAYDVTLISDEIWADLLLPGETFTSVLHLDTDRYFIPWTLLELNEVDRRRLILAAEIYTETQPAFWRLTGQYARLSGKEVEEMDSPCQLAH
ncbi:aminotransferase class I/II-fold pyridoxal phosphate-dependent enzyme [Salmonella enterica]|nr:aminotransferase class I/II-fold pyridoxal phosphate-dependent enzyme [Salmonella enterica]